MTLSSERRREICANWYRANRERHIARVVRQQRARRQLARMQRVAGELAARWLSGEITYSLRPGERKLLRLFAGRCRGRERLLIAR